MFRLLTDKYDVKVGKYRVHEGAARSLILNVTDHGIKFAFNSENDNYREFLISIAKEELGETLSSTNIQALNLQLESIEQDIQKSEYREKGCGCKVDEVFDEE